MDDTKIKLKTDVVLVVKGAGVHKADDTLNLFLQGFLPAVTSIDQNASVSQRTDVIDKDKYHCPPHAEDAHTHVTEINLISKGEKRRIWVKEAFWETELKPANPFSVLLKEWRMASYALGSLLHELVRKTNSKDRKEKGGGRLAWPRFFFAFSLNYFLIFWFILGLPNTAWEKQTLSLATVISIIIPALVAAMIWAIPPTMETYKLTNQQERLTALPGLGGWVLLPMVITLLIYPGRYFFVVLILLVLQVTLILSRAILWKFRKYDNSDTDTAEYFSDQETINSEAVESIGKKDKPFAKIFMMPLLYRYIILLLLPVTFVGYGIVHLLKLTRVLSGVGEGLEKVLSLALSSILGDVVSYAMDPAQAYRVRSVIANDIAYFSDTYPESHIHVFAHSQGTPITYETLFRDLPAKHQKKIITYITIGSILSYYNQAKEVLDAIYTERFPVPTYKVQHFHKNFKWINFWNFTDPITEFYGLDEYSRLAQAPPLDANGKPQPYNESTKNQFQRAPFGPRNVKSRASFKNHSEYWTNLDEIHIPFVKRILGNLKQTAWGLEQRKSLPIPHHSAVAMLWVLISAILGICIALLLSKPAQAFLTSTLTSLRTTFLPFFETYQAIYPPEGKTLGDQWGKLGEFFTAGPVQNVMAFLLRSALGLVPVLAILDWFRQFRRAIKIGKKPAKL